MPGIVPDSSVRTAQVAANAFTRVQVGLKNRNSPKPNNIFAAQIAKGYKVKGLAVLRGGR
jgi:hypothetical protein